MLPEEEELKYLPEELQKLLERFGEPTLFEKIDYAGWKVVIPKRDIVLHATSKLLLELIDPDPQSTMVVYPSKEEGEKEKYQLLAGLSKYASVPDNGEVEVILLPDGAGDELSEKLYYWMKNKIRTKRR